MPNFVIAPCTFEDGAAISLNNVTAFWQDKTWVLIWTRVGRTLEYVNSQGVLRGPQNLLNNREQKRHQKVVDVKTVSHQASTLMQYRGLQRSLLVAPFGFYLYALTSLNRANW